MPGFGGKESRYVDVKEGMRETGRKKVRSEGRHTTLAGNEDARDQEGN
jgi:hypothetical protein